jgi:hypothetical protein
LKGEIEMQKDKYTEIVWVVGVSGEGYICHDGTIQPNVFKAELHLNKEDAKKVKNRHNTNMSAISFNHAYIRELEITDLGTVE